MMYKLMYTLLATYMLIGCSKDETGVDSLMDQSMLELSTEEQMDLSFLREEEKLARDVYLYNYQLYGATIFSNIASSEQTHMDKVLELLELAALEDSMTSNEIGSFENEDLALLYTQLTQQSATSLEEALKVGALIEDLDIADIETMMEHTTNSALLSVYSNLVCGSKNHIRAYSRNIEATGESYTPHYISAEYYTLILSETSGGCGN